MSEQEETWDVRYQLRNGTSQLLEYTGERDQIRAQVKYVIDSGLERCYRNGNYLFIAASEIIGATIKRTSHESK